MNESLTVAIGVGLFYLLLNPGRVRNPPMLTFAGIAYAVSIAITLIARFGDGAGKAAVIISVLGTVSALVCIYIAINPFDPAPSAAASSSPEPPAAPASTNDADSNE